MIAPFCDTGTHIGLKSTCHELHLHTPEWVVGTLFLCISVSETPLQYEEKTEVWELLELRGRRARFAQREFLLESQSPHTIDDGTETMYAVATGLLTKRSEERLSLDTAELRERIVHHGWQECEASEPFFLHGWRKTEM
jgi:hypothetical protein